MIKNVACPLYWSYTRSAIRKIHTLLILPKTNERPILRITSSMQALKKYSTAYGSPLASSAP